MDDHSETTTDDRTDSGRSNGRRSVDGPPQEPAPGPENHLALVYETDEEQLAAVVPFVRQGLDRGERVMYVVDSSEPSDLVSAFRAAGIDVDDAMESGALTFHTPADTYEQDEGFDAERMIDYLAETARSAIEDDGYGRLRITGEMSWVLRGAVETLDALVEYESKLNEFYPGAPVTGLCQYDRTQFTPALLYDVIRAHPHQVYNATVCQNFAYLPPEEFFAAPEPVLDSNHLVETHLSRIRDRGKLTRREEDLATLASTGQALLDADDGAVVDGALGTVERALSPSIVALFRYDESEDDLVPASVAVGGESTETALPDRYREPLWDAFVSGEPSVFSNVQSGAELPRLGAVLQSGIAHPVGQHGVLFVGSTRAYAFDETDVQFVSSVATTTEAAFDRIDRERTLAEQNEQLRRVSRLNRVIRSIDQSLIRAPTRPDVERAVCEQLTEADAFRFAWIGDRDLLDGAFTVRAWAGEGESYLDDLRVRRDGEVDRGGGDDAPADSTSEIVRGPARTALETGEVQVVPNALTETMFDAWRTAALTRGFHACISVPLRHGDVEYGVLSVYADEPHAFSGTVRDVLAELGSTVAFAVDAVEVKAGVHADRKVEFKLHVADADDWLLRLARDVGCRIEVQTVLGDEGDRFRLFFTAPASVATAVVAEAEASVSVDAIRHIADRGDTALFEAVVTGETIPATVAAHDAVTQRLVADAEGVELVVELPQTRDPRSFVDPVVEAYPSTTVVSIRRVNQPVRSQQSFLSRLEERTTAKQLNALKLAYRSGYFEWPRERTAQDIAESLGIAQSTFSGHLRAGERKLFTELFDA